MIRVLRNVCVVCRSPVSLCVSACSNTDIMLNYPAEVQCVLVQPL